MRRLLLIPALVLSVIFGVSIPQVANASSTTLSGCVIRVKVTHDAYTVTATIHNSCGEYIKAWGVNKVHGFETGPKHKTVRSVLYDSSGAGWDYGGYERQTSNGTWKERQTFS